MKSEKSFNLKSLNKMISDEINAILQMAPDLAIQNIRLLVATMIKLKESINNAIYEDILYRGETTIKMQTNLLLAYIEDTYRDDTQPLVSDLTEFILTISCHSDTGYQSIKPSEKKYTVLAGDIQDPNTFLAISGTFYYLVINETKKNITREEALSNIFDRLYIPKDSTKIFLNGLLTSIKFGISRINLEHKEQTELAILNLANIIINFKLLGYSSNEAKYTRELDRLIKRLTDHESYSGSDIGRILYWISKNWRNEMTITEETKKG